MELISVGIRRSNFGFSRVKKIKHSRATVHFFEEESIQKNKSKPGIYYFHVPYGILMEEERYTEAENFLLSLPTESEEEVEFIEVQQLNHRRLLQTNENFELTDAENSFLWQAGMKTYPLAAYTRSLWYELNNEILYVPIPDIPVQNEDRSASINFNPSKPDVSISPNPSNDFFQLNIENQLSNSVRIEVYDVRGRLVYEIENLQDGDQISTAPIGKGIFISKIFDSDELVAVQKILVFK